MAKTPVSSLPAQGFFYFPRSGPGFFRFASGLLAGHLLHMLFLELMITSGPSAHSGQDSQTLASATIWPEFTYRKLFPFLASKCSWLRQCLLPGSGVPLMSDHNKSKRNRNSEVERLMVPKKQRDSNPASITCQLCDLRQVT